MLKKNLTDLKSHALKFWRRQRREDVFPDARGSGILVP